MEMVIVARRRAKAECGVREAGVIRVDLVLSVPQMFRLKPLNQLV